MKRVILLALALTASTLAFADSEHECQGNSCNGGSTSAAVGVGVGIAESSSKSSATAVSVNDVSVRNTVSSSNVNVAGGGSAYAKGGSAFSGAYSGGNTQTVTVTDSGKMHYSGGYEVKNVPNPPDVISNPTAPCRVAFSGSGSGAGFGIGIGGSVLDEGCDAREDARLLYNMGQPGLAMSRLCGKPELAKVIPTCAANEPAPAPAAQAPTPVQESVSWNGSSKLY